MTTLLEHRFNFTADDLAANQQGQLSVEQEKHVASIRKIRIFFRVIFLGSILLMRINMGLFSRHFWLFLVGWISLFVGNPFFRAQVFNMRKKTMKTILNAQQNDFIQYKTDPISLFSLEHEGDRIVINQRQWNALKPDTTYEIYYCSGLVTLTNEVHPIFSIRQHDGDSPQISALEHQFDFRADDIRSNASGRLSEDQILRLKTEIFYFRDIASMVIQTFGLIFILLWGGIITYTALGRLGIGYLLMVFLVTLPFTAASVYFLRLAHKWERGLDAGQVENYYAVQKRRFKLAPVPDNQPAPLPTYYFNADEVKFEISEEQYAALDDERGYRFYYFPMKGTSRNHMILAIE